MTWNFPSSEDPTVNNLHQLHEAGHRGMRYDPERVRTL